MGDATFLATWDDTGDVGIVNLTEAELKEFTTNTASDKGKYIYHLRYQKHHFYWHHAYCQESDENY